MTVFSQIMRLRSQLVAGLRGLFQGRSGNFAVMAAILALPLLGAAGLAIDYTNMLSIKTKLSDSLDAAAFEAAKLYTRNASREDIQSNAGSVFAANMGGAAGQGSYMFSYDGVSDDNGSKVIKVDATVRYDPVFLPVLWNTLAWTKPRLQIRRSSEVSLATSTVEVALVLDNSGSMAGGKLASLKEAAGQLVDDLFSSATRGTDGPPVQMSIVPFAASVNVGASNESAAWMDTTGVAKYHHENFDWSTLGGAARQSDGSWELNGTKLTRFWLYDRMHTPWRGCVEARPYPYDVNNFAPDPTVPDTLFVPMFAPDEPDTGSADSYFYNSYLNDDVGSRTSDLGDGGRGRDHAGSGDATDLERQQNMTKYAATPHGGDGGPNASCTSDSILPMASDKNQVKEKLDELWAYGNTNVPEGAAWGLRTLTPGSPFDGPRDFGTKGNIKAMVLMTDGENTYSPVDNMNKSTYAAYGYAGAGHVYEGTTNATSLANAMDQHLLQVCATARAENVMVFTIAFDVTDGSSIKTMLDECASDDATSGGKLYFDVKNNGSDLQKAFGAIGSKISALRLYR